MVSLLTVLLIVGLVGITWSTLWENQFDLAEDLKVLQRGSNLIYLTVGDFEHNVAVALELTKSFQSQGTHCIDICSGRDILPVLNDLSGNGRGEVVVIHGVEYIAPNERRVMDFAYRLTDSSSELSNIVVLFVVQSENSVEEKDLLQLSPPVNHSQQLELKLALAEALNEDSVFFNGHAFTGRLTRTSFQPQLTDIKLNAAGCNHRRVGGQDICQRLSAGDKSTQIFASTLEGSNNQVGFADSGFCPPNKATKVVLLGVILAALYIAVYCWCKNKQEVRDERSKKTSASGSTTAYSASVVAQVVGHSGAGSNLYTGASSSGELSQTNAPPPYTEQSYSYEDNVHRTPERAPRVRQNRSTKPSTDRSSWPSTSTTKRSSPALVEDSVTPQRSNRSVRSLRSAGKTKDY